MPLGQSALVAVTAHQIAFQIYYGLKRSQGHSKEAAATEASAAALKTAAAATGCAAALTADAGGFVLGTAYLASIEAARNAQNGKER